MFQEKNEIISFKPFQKQKLTHGFFLRQKSFFEQTPIPTPDRAFYTAQQRPRLAAHLKVPPEYLVFPVQIHSSDVCILHSLPSRNLPLPLKVDGLVTRLPKIALTVRGADCGMVLFYEPHIPVIGVAHAGWLGALEGILEATVAAMEKLGACRKNIQTVLGPTIGCHSYEVGPERRKKILAQDLRNITFFSPSLSPDHDYFNLPAYIQYRLQEAGVSHFWDCGMDTYQEQEKCFSYRRACHENRALEGNLIGAIALG